MSDDEEAKGVDYLAKTIILPRKIGPVGFIHHKAQAGAAKPDKPKRSSGHSRSVSSAKHRSVKRPKA